MGPNPLEIRHDQDHFRELVHSDDRQRVGGVLRGVGPLGLQQDVGSGIISSSQLQPLNQTISRSGSVGAGEDGARC